MEKFLPIGVQNFAEMIKSNFVYVDKTQYIYEMVRIPQAFYFLSRPQRFGKSLLVSTLKALFEGKRELFNDLWIDRTEWQWQKHPVILIDFSGITLNSPKSLGLGIHKRLTQIAETYQIDFHEDYLKEGFKEIILNLYEKYQTKVVILVDEYDKPLIEHLGFGANRLEIAKENRDLLKQFFGILKDADVSEVLRFIFLTGISKFSKVSIFSDLNNLDDLTMQEEFCSILGYTQDELNVYFERFIDKLAEQQKISKPETLKKIERWYNGYRFTEQDIKVYNPFSVLKLLKYNKFQNYWFETATPSFLLNLIKEKQYPISEIETLELDVNSFSVYDLEYLELEPLLFQTGYITIEDVKDNFYKLRYPNQEVKISFSSYLYNQFVNISRSSIKKQYARLNQHLQAEQIEKFIDTTNAILSSIPYQHIYDQDEHYYHTVFYLMLSAGGVPVQTEVLSSHGRIDMEVHFCDKVYVIELKCDQAAEKAIEQIKTKKYHEKHLHSDKKLFLLGINFDTQERRITDWKMEFHADCL